MSTSNYTLIQQLLDARLETISTLPTLVKENTRKVDSKATETWVRSSLLPTIPDFTSIGSNGLTEYRGLYQVSCFVPVGYGPDDGNTLADLIINTFPKGLRLGQLMIWKAYRVNALIEDNKFTHIPIRIEWSYWS
jgi:hypothetical protein